MKTKFTGVYIRSEKPYLSVVKNAKEIHVSDFCPNSPFQKVEDSGYKEISRDHIDSFDYTGKKVWYRRSTSMGRSRVYIEL